MFFVSIGPKSGQQRENGANQKIHQTWVSISLCFHLSLLKSTLPSLHTSTTRSTARLTHAISSKQSTLSPAPPRTTSPQPMTLPLFSQTKLRSISSQFSAPHVQELKPTTSIAKTSLFAFCPLTESEVSKLLLSSHPTTCPLDPIPLTPSPSNLSYTLTSTHTHHQHISPYRHLPQCTQAGSGNPTPQKTCIKHFTYRSLQTCLSHSIHSQNTRASCFQPVILISVKA